MATYTLPELPYDYGALAPHISGEIMELHHGKHHQTYVNALNDAIGKLAAASDNGDFGPIVGLEKTLAFNLGGHVNHSIFWKTCPPTAAASPRASSPRPSTSSSARFDSSRPTSPRPPPPSRAPAGPSSPGTPLAGRLHVFQLTDQQGNIPIGQTPVVLLDKWEHAFYLQYKNVKPDYVKAWWNVVNWADAAERFAAANR